MPGHIGKYEIGKTLGQGYSCKVKYSRDTETGEKYAIKIIHQDKIDLVQNEVDFIRNLKHQHVIELIDVGKDIYQKKNGTQKEVYYLVFEYAKGGELFDFIQESGQFSEDEARYYFLQLLDGLDYCHRSGIAHRDLKPENLLLDRNFDMKIADFGFAAPIEGRTGDGYLETQKGTSNYMAPEILEGHPYKGYETDLFSSGIILFIMVME